MITYFGKKITTLTILFTQMSYKLAYECPRKVKVRELIIKEKDGRIDATFHFSWGIEFDRMKIVMK